MTKPSLKREILFPSFKKSKWIVIVCSIFSMILGIAIFLFTPNGYFNAEILRSLSQMAINIQFLLSTLIISAVSINAGGNKEKDFKKKEIILSYIGGILVIASIGVLGYVLSYIVDLLPNSSFITKLYCTTMVLSVIWGITNSTKYFMEIFDLK